MILETGVVEAEVASIAIALPGTVDYEKGLLQYAHNLDWKDKDVRGDLEKRFDHPVNVRIENDANVGALGQAHSGAGKGYRSVLYVTLSTGIGTGVIIDGNVAPALRLSEGGKMRFEWDGTLQKWEDFASGKAFVKRFGTRGDETSDPAVWKQYAESIAQGFYNLTMVVMPDVIVIGGSMGTHFYRYGDMLKAEIDRIAPECEDFARMNIVGATDSDNAVINGTWDLATCR